MGEAIPIFGRTMLGEESSPLTQALESNPRWHWRLHPSSHETPSRPYVIAAGDGQTSSALRMAVPFQFVQDAEVIKGAQLVESDEYKGKLDIEDEESLGRQLMTQLHSSGVHTVIAVPGETWSYDFLRRLEFQHPFDVALRHLYIGLSPVSSRLNQAALAPFRKLAEAARNLRMKLIEENFDETWLGYAARLFQQRMPDVHLGVFRDESYLKWRYKDHPERDYRLLVLRRRAGMGLDAFVVVRVLEPRPGRRYIQLVDHWTREGERRSTAWLLGELALWGMAEGADTIQAFAVRGSTLDQVLKAAGCIRKKASFPFMVKQLHSPTSEWTTARAHLRAGDLDAF